MGITLGQATRRSGWPALLSRRLTKACLHSCRVGKDQVQLALPCAVRRPERPVHPIRGGHARSQESRHAAHQPSQVTDKAQPLYVLQTRAPDPSPLDCIPFFPVSSTLHPQPLLLSFHLPRRVHRNPHLAQADRLPTGAITSWFKNFQSSSRRSSKRQTTGSKSISDLAKRRCWTRLVPSL